jgi:hypothetical protein
MNNLDIMAFAKGASLANQENWRDVLNANQAAGQNEALRQSQTRFDMALPRAQTVEEQKLGDLAGNRRYAESLTNTLTNLSKVPLENRDAYLVASVQEAMKGIDPRQPGALRELDNYTRWIQQQSAVALQKGQQPLASSLMALIPGSQSHAAKQAADVALWSNPQSAYDPAVIQSGGGSLNPDGMVTYAGTKMYPSDFASLKLKEANTPYRNPYGDLGRLEDTQARRDVGQDEARLMDSAGRAYAHNPRTGQLVPLGFNIQPPVASQPSATPLMPHATDTWESSTAIPGMSNLYTPARPYEAADTGMWDMLQRARQPQPETDFPPGGAY